LVIKQIAAAAGVAVVTAGLASPAAHAETPDNCATQFWMVGLRSTTRIICDGPISADGSWERGRSFYAPAYVTNSWSSCYGSGYFVNCTTTPAREVPEFDQRAYYRVTAATVLTDEPGHLGAGAVA